MHKSHFVFVENWPILTKIFRKFHLQSFYDYIDGLHLSDNYGIFNIIIEDFIGKNSEKITKIDPSFSNIKVKTPKIELVISSERSWILTFRKKRWNHSNEFFKISLTCFFDPGPPYRLKWLTAPLRYFPNSSFNMSLQAIQKYISEGAYSSLKMCKLERSLRMRVNGVRNGLQREPQLTIWNCMHKKKMADWSLLFHDLSLKCRSV